MLDIAKLHALPEEESLKLLTILIRGGFQTTVAPGVVSGKRNLEAVGWEKFDYLWSNSGVFPSNADQFLGPAAGNSDDPRYGFFYGNWIYHAQWTNVGGAAAGERVEVTAEMPVGGSALTPVYKYRFYIPAGLTANSKLADIISPGPMLFQAFRSESIGAGNGVYAQQWAFDGIKINWR